jgi:hypothetical protein
MVPGQNGTRFPAAWSDRLDDFFPNVRLQYIDGVGHFTPLECPNEFAAALAAASGIDHFNLTASAHAHHFLAAGGTLWLRWNRLVGSYRLLIAASRSQVSPG